jgi:hypothetical protein
MVAIAWCAGASSIAAAAGAAGSPSGDKGPVAPGSSNPPIGDNLSQHLDKSGGVITPPQGVDPQMQVKPPEGASAGKMRVIPPPGSPGGNPNVVPK